MNRIICHICLFFACACAIAQSAPVKIQPNPEAAAKKAEENIKKYSSLFPPTEGATGKIGAGFWESHWGYAAAAAALLAIIACIAFRPKKKPEATPSR